MKTLEPPTVSSRNGSPHGAVSFGDVFNLEEIQKIQDSFATATGVASIITDPSGHPITKESNFSHLCGGIIRKTALGLQRCCHSDCVLVHSKPGGVAVNKCLSAGLWDGGAGIFAGERHIANWLIGQVVDEETDFERVLAFGKEIGADEEEFRLALSKVPRMSRSQFEKVARALAMVAGQLSLQARHNLELSGLAAGRRQLEDSVRDLNARLKAATAHIEALEGGSGADTRSKSAFLAMMSHELNTPLNGVIGCAEVLASTRLDAEQRDFALTIFESGKQLLGVLNNILEFANLEQCPVMTSRALFSTSGLLDSACHLAQKAAAEKGLSFRCVQSPGVPPFISGDERRIRQVLSALLGNAVKYTAHGSVVLRVTTGGDDAGDVLVFSVEDTGVGIPAEKFDLLFKPFSQLDAVLQRSHDGAGLGLAICARLAEAMHGTISVESAAGIGSTFTFRLPYIHPGGQIASESNAPAAADPQAESREVVLVVDDDSINSYLAGYVLERMGFRTEFAINGAEAVKAFVPGKFHAILMDVTMPVMNGIDATLRIRERDRGLRVPIIALTADVTPENREQCIKAGMDDFLGKPLRKGELSSALFRLGHPLRTSGAAAGQRVEAGAG